VRIGNSGGNFNSGILRWNASTSATEITLLTASGTEGENLEFRVDPGKLPTGTYTRTITVTAYNSVTMTPASNSPLVLTVSIQVEPIGTVSVTQAVGAGWTPFLNSSGHKIAEVKSNSGPISSMTITMYPCMLPRGINRLRYVRRYFTVTTGAGNPNVDIRFFYTNTESMPMVSHPAALHVYQRPAYLWVDMGGTSNALQNFVQLTGLANLAGEFVMAHGWFPKEAETAVLPDDIRLAQNYPNPFNPSTILSFSIPAPMHVRLSVYDMYGRRLSGLTDAMHEAGTHQVVFDASGLPSGTYVAVLEAGGQMHKRSMLLLK
jgi:hypothetical protein